jgi:hypothetical protein
MSRSLIYINKFQMTVGNRVIDTYHRTITTDLGSSMSREGRYVCLGGPCHRGGDELLSLRNLVGQVSQ